MGERIESLAKEPNLTLEFPQGHLGLRKSIEEQKRRELFTRAQQGDFGAIYQLLSHFGPLVDAQTQQLVPEVRRRVTEKVAGKVLEDLPNIEWQGSTKFAGWLYITIRNAKVDQRRKESRDAKKRTDISENPNNNLNEPPRNLLDLWIEEHPEKAEELISSLTDLQKQVFKASRHGLSTAAMVDLFQLKSEGSGKVTLHKARVLLAEKAGIQLPEGYKPIKDFTGRGISYGIICKNVRKGKVEGAIRFLGMYYLTEQIFGKHFGERLLLAENHLPETE